jgi:hypothetical protein
MKWKMPEFKSALTQARYDLLRFLEDLKRVYSCTESTVWRVLHWWHATLSGKSTSSKDRNLWCSSEASLNLSMYWFSEIRNKWRQQIENDKAEASGRCSKIISRISVGRTFSGEDASAANVPDRGAPGLDVRERSRELDKPTVNFSRWTWDQQDPWTKWLTVEKSDPFYDK